MKAARSTLQEKPATREEKIAATTKPVQLVQEQKGATVAIPAAKPLPREERRPAAVAATTKPVQPNQAVAQAQKAAPAASPTVKPAPQTEAKTAPTPTPEVAKPISQEPKIAAPAPPEVVTPIPSEWTTDPVRPPKHIRLVSQTETVNPELSPEAARLIRRLEAANAAAPVESTWPAVPTEPSAPSPAAPPAPSAPSAPPAPSKPQQKVTAAESRPEPRRPVQQQDSVRPVVTPGEGRLISFHADELDVRKAFEILSRQTGMSIVVSPDVKGNVTLELPNKTPDEVLDIIAQLCRLAIRRENGIVYVFAQAEMRQREKEDLPVRVYHLNYVRSEDVKDMIEDLLKDTGGRMTISKTKDWIDEGLVSSVNTSISSAGTTGSSATVKGGSNRMAGSDIVIVQAPERVLKMVDRVIAQIDVQPIQVLIEAVIVQITLEKGMDLGVNFALLDDAGKTLGVVGSGAAINSAAGFSPASVVTSAGKVSTGFATDTNGLKFGFVTKNTTGFLNLLETFGETKVLASPRLMVLNKQRAELHIGKCLGYKTTVTSSTTTSEEVSYMNVGTQLRFRPFVATDGMIRMEIHPERSSGEIDTDGIPQTTTSQITTNVLVPDGTTMVIGGLLDDEVIEGWKGVPFLSRLPWIGSVFRDTTTSSARKELIVILTPHIWRPECPQHLNNLGKPQALGLDKRVGTTAKAGGKVPPSLYELTKSSSEPTPCPVAPAAPEAESPPEVIETPAGK